MDTIIIEMFIGVISTFISGVLGLKIIIGNADAFDIFVLVVAVLVAMVSFLAILKWFNSMIKDGKGL